ncbi:MAG: hypothetical protein VW397_02345, partial [Candidatus Margulisiibacteriota bacterium]
TIWNDAISVKEQARLLSQIYQFNISESELQILIRFIQNESINLFYPTTPLRPDNVEKLKRSKSIMNKENLEYKIVSFQDEYNYLQETFPFKLLKNGDVEYKLATHNDGDSFYLNLKENQTIQTHTLRSFQLDSIRDTIIHWGIIDSMYRHQQVSILDPFALELIAERLSEYLGILLEVTRINSKSVANEFSTFSRYRFIQNNELKTIWENENPLLPKAYF